MRSKHKCEGIPMERFESTVMKTKRGAYYFDIPQKIMKEFNLRPFMAGRMRAGKKGLIISDFEKTVKIKADLKKKDIEMIRKIMKEEGYGSIDETISNVLHRIFEPKKEDSVVYIYPEGFLNSKFTLINDYQKYVKKKKSGSKNSEKKQ